VSPESAPYTGPVLAAESTSSAWIGVNVDSDFPYADLRSELTGFVPDNNGALDTNGYPTAGVSATSNSDIGETIPTGIYNLSYVGTGTLQISGIGTQVSPWTVVNGENRTTVQITGTPQKYPSVLNFRIVNQPGQTVTNIHLYLPGIDFDTPLLFNPLFLQALTPFRQMRFMDWMNTNNSALEYWSDHPTLDHFGTNPFGVPYEYIVGLANATGKDLWINIPELANNDFCNQFANYLIANLDFDKINSLRQAQGILAPFNVLLENSNETWNTGFSAYGTFLVAAQQDGALYTGAYTGRSPDWVSADVPLMQVAQYEADRLAQIGIMFKTVFATINRADAIETVLGGWGIAANYSYEGLDFISKHYDGPVSNYINYIAITGYISGAVDGNINDLFTSLNSSIAGQAFYFAQFKALSQEFGVQVAAYEGGGGYSGAANEMVVHLAQHDVRMHDAYILQFNLWKQYFGESRFNQFTLSSGEIPEVFYEYGFWGSLETIWLDLSTCGQNLPTLTGNEAISSVISNCPKYQAILEQVGN
jgi:hypothetical protein